MDRNHHRSPSLQSSHSLPPRYTVPPLPPVIHRHLLLTRDPEHGIVIVPQGANGSETANGVAVSWGVKGSVHSWEGDLQGDSIEIGGILGIVRLWDTAYLLVFLPPLKEPSPLFSDHVANIRDETQRRAPASSHHYHALDSVYSVPLTAELSAITFGQLQSIQEARKPKHTKRRKPFDWKFGLNIPIRGAGYASSEEMQSLAENSDEESDSGSESDSESDKYVDGATLAAQPSRESVAPEADDSPVVMAEENKERSKRFSVGWDRFIPKIRKPASTSKLRADANTSASTSTENLAKPVLQDPPQRRELEGKIIGQIVREFSSGGFFYSFDTDLTRSLQQKRQKIVARHTTDVALAHLLNQNSKDKEKDKDESIVITSDDDFIEPDIHVPLWRRVDRRFFWNEFLLKDFLDQGLHSFALPIMQGWVQSSTFTLPVPPNPLSPEISLGEVPVDLVVISRRSRDRAGLRYQRRGIDDEGHVANMVETEMIVRAKVEGKVSLFSFVQVRGSIPLKWSQSPYSMKPPPVLDQPVDQSFSVANLHFDDLKSRYGPITIVNLSEQSGKEGTVTNGYRDLVQSLERSDVTYRAFDFHAKCHGMKWENISELVEGLDFGTMGYLWSLQNEEIRQQTGVFRTNCIDCLDRTNVVQSAIARYVLSSMLTQLGMANGSPQLEAVFNDAWANNGDMLSLCYAHTSALKGDFVRTGKRDLQGMLNDGISSISRMFYGAVSDFFAQAVISFFLGHRTLSVFSEFLESLASTDVSNLTQISRIRAAAVETSTARVINEGEERLAGWTLMSPENRGTTLTPKLEEKILLLTPAAIYVVSFNFSLEKVVGFTRIPLASITSIQKGPYILSALQEAGRDPVENYGFILRFSPINESTRYSTYSIRNKSYVAASDTPSTPVPSVEHAEINPLISEFFAFKVLAREFNVQGGNDTDVAPDDQAAEIGAKIVSCIKEECERSAGGKEVEVVEKDVVSLAEAQRSTSLVSRMDYAVKRFLWL